MIFRDIAQDAFPDLWPRVWKYITFLDSAEPYSQLENQKLDEGNLALFSLIAVSILIWKPANLSMPHLIWRIALRPESGVLSHPAFTGLCNFVGHCKLKELDKSLFDEFVEGAGGGLDDLSSLVVRHIELARCRNSQPHARIPFFLDCVFTFLITADIRDTPFFNALLAYGLATALTSAACSLEISLPGAPYVGWKCWNLLEWVLEDDRGYHRIIESLQAGILTAIVAGHDNNRTGNTLEFMHTILMTSLPASTVYYTVLVHMKTALDKIVLTAANEKELQKSGLLVPWQSFVKLVQHRLQVLERFDSREFESCKSCDNAENAKRAIGGKAAIVNIALFSGISVCVSLSAGPIFVYSRLCIQAENDNLVTYPRSVVHTCSSAP
ncbi:hypothetical protein DFH09DRAFT_1108806 [Mycena vulgaris]|nr:hypothetical protein DFH09DRAFT_1108806 [Mycena vulgaris]